MKQTAFLGTARCSWGLQVDEVSRGLAGEQVHKVAHPHLALLPGGAGAGWGRGWLKEGLLGFRLLHGLCLHFCFTD